MLRNIIVIVLLATLFSGVLSHFAYYDFKRPDSVGLSKTFWKFHILDTINSWSTNGLQFWFPWFRPLAPGKIPAKKPGTDKGSSKPGIVNIFGISGPPGDDVEYLPDEIEW